ncbi:MAG: RagB/SusD family nutrient uptake outer membrane protein [Bacteroidetes bacterium]|nr:RagB/SusD family nutrient uptake outer membrane protein [Bacteroidota bacterium]
MKLRTIQWGFAVLMATTLFSCKRYVDTPIAPNQLSPTDTYSTDASATSAAVAMYSFYYTTNSIGWFNLAGSLAADDIQYTGSTAATVEMANANVTTSNSNVLNYLWSYPYSVVREANQLIAGVSKSTGMTAAGKSQISGEAKFMRALYFFNMVNYFGGVPLTLSETELDNALLPRADTSAVYAQIIADLKDAENLLPAAYVTSLRARPNKYAAAALLARAYLYKKDYANAEAEATKVIGAADVSYSMPVDSMAFVNTSPEVILQFATLYGYSQFGSAYRTSVATVAPAYTLNPIIANAFEAGDYRRRDWVDSVTVGTTKYYKIRKYKLVTATAGNEYDVILRLAAQYLIRAEARAQQSNISGAQADVNAIRTRSGLGGTPAVTKADLLTAIAQERKVELFGEMSHRWFDLKRTGLADATIAPLKPTTWKPTAVLMPIPVSQILVNNNLAQNPGYSN